MRKWYSQPPLIQLESWQENAKLQLIAGVVPWVLRILQLLSATILITLIISPLIWQYWVLFFIFLTSVFFCIRSVKYLNKGDWKNSTFMIEVALVIAATGFVKLIKGTTIILALVVLLLTILAGIQFSPRAGFLFAISFLGLIMSTSLINYYELMPKVGYRIGQPEVDGILFIVGTILITLGANIIFLDHKNMITAVSHITAQASHLQQANKQLEVMNQTKTKFMSDVSHELRTPVTNLALYLDLLTRGKPEKRPAYLKILEGQTEKLHQLIEKILELTRLDMMSVIAKPALVDLDEIITTLVVKFQQQAQNANIQLIYTTANLPPIHGNASYISLAISNLIENAISYTIDGSVQIKTSLYKKDYLQCQITDSGIGVSEDEYPHIFERFYRGNAAVETSVSGFGLGLSIVEKVMELHHGHIDIDNQRKPGNGFAITLAFPLA